MVETDWGNVIHKARRWDLGDVIYMAPECRIIQCLHFYHCQHHLIMALARQGLTSMILFV